MNHAKDGEDGKSEHLLIKTSQMNNEHQCYLNIALTHCFPQTSGMQDVVRWDQKHQGHQRSSVCSMHPTTSRNRIQTPSGVSAVMFSRKHLTERLILLFELTTFGPPTVYQPYICTKHPQNGINFINAPCKNSFLMKRCPKRPHGVPNQSLKL